MWQASALWIFSAKVLFFHKHQFHKSYLYLLPANLFSISELLLAIHVALFYFVHDAFFLKVAMPDSREAQLDLTVAQGTLPTRIQLRSMVIIFQVTKVVTNPNSPMGFLRIQRWTKTLTI